MSAIMAEMIRQNTWATLRLLDACEALSEAQLEARVTGTYGSIRDTLVHLVGAEERYLAALTGAPPSGALRDGFPGLATLREIAGRTGAALAAAAEQARPEQELRGEWRGRPYVMPVAVPLIQAVNHATEHRSQIMTIMTQQGVQPPELDGWTYWESALRPVGSQARS